MDRDKVKFLIQSIEVLIDELKAEVYTKEETHSIGDTDYAILGDTELYSEITHDLF